jgi:hypothetical protein
MMLMHCASSKAHDAAESMGSVFVASRRAACHIVVKAVLASYERDIN